MGESASQTDLKEAFCRDIDAYSFEFEPQNAGLQPRVQQPLVYPPAPVTPGYRDDMDTVGVRAGCTLTAYSDSSFNGDRIDIKATTIDRWVVFADHAEFKHMDSD